MKFYSKQELSALRKLIPIKKGDIKSALQPLADQFKRTVSSLYWKLGQMKGKKKNKLKRAYAPRQARNPVQEATVSKNEIRIPYKSVTASDGELIFKF